MKYYISDGKQKFGPFSIGELKNYSLDENTLIWYKGLEKWKLAKNIPEIKDLYSSETKEITKTAKKNLETKQKKIVKKEINVFTKLKTKITLLIISLLGIFFLLVVYYSNNNFLSKKSAVSTLKTFFKEINNKNYNKAYQLSKHSKWNTLVNFINYMEHWHIDEEVNYEGKSYFSLYDADTIINVTFIGSTDISENKLDRNYDFHMKKINNDWKIIRIYLSRDPNLDVLRKEEVPKTAEEAVSRFLEFLNLELYEKAYQLTKNSNWGVQNKFLSDDGFGCVSEVIVYETSQFEVVNENLEIIYAKYWAKDLCNASSTHELYFHVSKKADYWRITKLTKSY